MDYPEVSMDSVLSPVKSLEQLARFSRRVSSLPVTSGVGPIGFDLGRAALRAVQIQHGRFRPVLKAAVSADYPCERQELLADSKRLRKFVADSFKGRGFKGRKIVCCTPAENLRLMSLEYPVSDDFTEEQAIVSQLAQRIDGDLSNYVIDYIPSRDPGAGGKRTALVAVAEMEKQIAWMELLRQAGLQVVGLEIGPIAIRRLVENVSKLDQIPNTLVVNCGSVNTYLTVTSGRRLILDRGIRFGETDLVGRVAKALDMEFRDAWHLMYLYGVDKSMEHHELIKGLISSEDIIRTILEVITPAFHELTREIEKVSAYVHSQLRGADIQRVFLLGSVARWPGSDVYLNGLLDLPVSVLNPFESFQADPKANTALASSPVAGMALAAGCALSRLR